MKTLKKIIWFIVIILIVYIVLIFVKPAIANNIAEKIGISAFNEQIRTIKDWIDIFSTKIPTKEEIIETYSWAKDSILDLKDNIDDIRETADGLWEKYGKSQKGWVLILSFYGMQNC